MKNVKNEIILMIYWRETALVSILNLILPVQISSKVPRGEDVE